VIARPTPARWTAWVFAVVLLLKAAVPLLATASAHAQGKTLVEVCTVYGVATVALDGQDSTPAPDHATPHAGDHCALTGLAALAAPGTPPPMAPMPGPIGTVALAHPSPQAPDACATWVARLKHGPPALA
jgi:hypothetical protein